jgi:uncharacterized membrane protein YbaN (DUF454 family)
MRRTFFFVMGWVALVIGLVGIFVPLLPTTPFLLVAAFCFSRSSERFHHWLVHHRHFGPLIRTWQREKAIPLRAKVIALLMMAGSLVWLAWTDRVPPTVKIFPFVFVLATAVFVITRPLPRRERRGEGER